jgi:uncharacterized protein YdhG (YjbR/CyaY superfamily)
MPTHTTVDEYIATFSPAIRERLAAVRATIQAAAPDATEKISYQLPTFVLHGNLIYYGAWKQHLAIYPAGRDLRAFDDELAPYTRTKGAIHFLHDQPLPLDLIARIAAHRAAENRAAADARKRKPAS